MTKNERAFKMITAAVPSLLAAWFLLYYQLPRTKWATEYIGKFTNKVKERFPHTDFTQVFPEYTEAEIEAVQMECYTQLEYDFEPFTHFRPETFAGEALHVSPNGYRQNSAMDQHPWPPKRDRTNIFVFGGSTAFGYGVKDEDTIAAHLEEILLSSSMDVEVYNFGRAFYYSSQELALFQTLLRRDYIPNLAIFIDGLNDFTFGFNDKPTWDDRFHKLMGSEPPPNPTTPSPIERVLRVYDRNMRMAGAIARHFGVETMFIGQPVSSYQYTRTPENFPFDPPYPTGLCEQGYDEFHELFKSKPEYIWLGDIFKDEQEIVYGNGIHYNPKGNRMIAERIAGHINRKVYK